MSFMIYTPHKILPWSDLGNGVAQTYGMCRGVEKCVGAICGGNLQEGDHVEDVGAAGRVLLSWFVKK